MAKRHKHFGSNKTKANVKSKSKKTGKNKSIGKSARTFKRKFLPVGGGDLVNQDMVEDYYFGHLKKKNTLKSGGFRPGRVFDDDLMDSRLPLRQRPVEFIRAKEVYDPSHDLILKLIANSKDKSISDTIDVLEGRPEDISREPSVIASEGSLEESEFDSEIHQLPYHSMENDKNDTNEKENNQNEDMIDDEELFYVDVNGNKAAIINNYKTTHVESEEELKEQEYGIGNGCTIFEPILRVGNVELNLKKNGKDDIEIKRPTASYHPFYKYVQNVMKNMAEDFSDEEDEINDYENSSDDEYEINCYKNSLVSQPKTQNIHKEASSYITQHEDHIMKKSKIEQCDSSMKSLTIEDQVIENSHTKAEHILSADDNDSLPKEPEFGFCEEDFACSIGKIFVTNIRLGSNDRSYQISCQDIYGDNASRWVDQETMNEMVEEMGLPEHRMEAYFKHLYDSLLEKNSNSSDFSDIPFEDSDSDGSEKSESAEPDFQDVSENLDDLVEYTLKYSKDRNQAYDSSPLRLRGKRRNKQLVFDDDTTLDRNMRLMLQDKFTTRESNRTKKRRTKEDFVAETFKNSLDLLEKYPYGLHIQNIKDEFECFYHSNRKSITFPPLDPHGNKVIAKFAYNYFMKSTIISKGKSTKVYVEKTKKTKYNQPAYHIISQLLRQRPVFMRIDKKLPSEESSTFNRTVRLKVPKAKFNITEGQVVGEDAPEIGSDNVGRRMLEKLGWNTGQGLGAHGNKGIQEPILAKVKKSKSGLRHM